MITDQIVDALRRLTGPDRERVVSELSKPSRPTMAATERRKLCEKLAALVRGFETQSAELKQKHEAALARVEEARRDAGASWEALAELNASHREERDRLWAVLRADRSPAIDAFIAETHELAEALPLLREARRAVHPFRSWDYVAGENGDSVDRRRDAIERALHQADGLSFEALDDEAIIARLDGLRASIPEVESAEAVLRRKLREIRARGPAPEAA